VDIETLKQKLNLPALMDALGYGDCAKPLCSSPFREDRNPSWGIKEEDGRWFFNDFATNEGGDEIDFIKQALNLDTKAAIAKYKELAGVIEPRVVLEDKPSRIDWTVAKASFKPAHHERLSEWRGYSPEFVTWLHENSLVGVVQGQLAFPINHNPQTTPNGEVDGAHLFSKDKGWRILGGRNAPWWIGDHSEHVFVFESQWDAFAFMDKVHWAASLSTQSSIVITRGASAGKKLQGLLPAKSQVYLFTQNDEPARKWQDDITSIHPRCKVVDTPAPHKDLNEWVNGGGTGAEIVQAMEEARIYEDPSKPLRPQPLDWNEMLAFNAEDDPDCMLGKRWLARGNSCVWVGSSGLGKSVLTIQAAMTWAAGQPFFGITPKGKYSSLILQQENNFGDVAETIQGVKRGLEAECPQINFNEVTKRVKIIRLVNSMGLEFFAAVKDMVVEHQPDMLWIDPLLCYLAGDPNSSEDMSIFTNQLDELAMDTGILVHLIHHTGKPKTSRDTSGFTTNDLSYAGLGSSVLTNWARAIMVLQGERGEEGIFRLTAAKRGTRSQMCHEDSPPGSHIYLEHSNQGLCWLPSDYEPEERKVGRPAKEIDFGIYRTTLNDSKIGYATRTELANAIANQSDCSVKTMLRRIDNIIQNGDIVFDEQSGNLKWNG